MSDKSFKIKTSDLKKKLPLPGKASQSKQIKKQTKEILFDVSRGATGIDYDLDCNDAR